MKRFAGFIFIAALIFCHNFSFAQNNSRATTENNHLLKLYHQWYDAGKEVNIFSNQLPGIKTITSNYYPGKATNYSWNSSTSSWDILDTTFYTYIGVGLVTSVTRKDYLNNYLTRVLNAYDASNNLIETINQTWSATWVNSIRDTFAFDLYNNVTLHLHQTWGGSAWNTSSGASIQYSYSGSGKILVQITQTWNGTSWDNSSRISNTYNVTDQVMQTIRESWNGSTSMWVNISKSDYIYDISNVNTQSIDYLWSGSTWNYNAQIINPVWVVWTGDISTSKPQSYIYQTWSGSAWVNSQKLLNATYDSFGGSVETYQQFISSAWVNDTRNSVFFDNQLNKTGERNETWNIPLLAWDTTYEYKYIFTYDVNNSITQSIYQQFNTSQHTYVNYLKTDYSDFLYLSVFSLLRENEISISLQPNPLTDESVVIFSSSKFIPASYSVCDELGKKVLEEKIHGSNFRLSKNNFSSGIYFLKVTGARGEEASVKFIVQ